MNKKVLKVMIALVIIFLSTLYIVKIFFPEQFVMAIENPVLISIGDYLDANEWAFIVFGIITSYLTYWLYLCATCEKWYLRWYENIAILVTIGISIGLNYLDLTLCSAFSIASFVFLPAMFKGKLINVGVTYSIHLISQALSLTIRNLPIYMTEVNSLILHVAGAETYLWLLLLYFYYNYGKGGQ